MELQTVTEALVELHSQLADTNDTRVSVHYKSSEFGAVVVASNVIDYCEVKGLEAREFSPEGLSFSVSNMPTPFTNNTIVLHIGIQTSMFEKPTFITKLCRKG